MKNFILFILLFLFTGCVASTYTAQVPVSNVIPPRMQQQIHTASNKKIDFKFTGNPKADSVSVKAGNVTNIYKINKPLESLYRELAETKFQKLESDSKNKIDVKIKDFKTTTKKDLHALNLTVTVQLQNGDRKDKRTFNYQTNVGFNFAIGNIIFLPNESINQLLEKFIVASDKYIDTFYGVN